MKGGIAIEPDVPVAPAKNQLGGGRNRLQLEFAMRRHAPTDLPLEYSSPDAVWTKHSGRGIASITCAALTTAPFYWAVCAVVDSHAMPGHYFPLLVFSYLFWVVLLGTGLGVFLAVAGLRQTHRRRAVASWGLLLNGLLLAGLAVMMVLIRGGTQSP